jgi:hypothetical protein
MFSCKNLVVLCLSIVSLSCISLPNSPNTPPVNAQSLETLKPCKKPMLSYAMEGASFDSPTNAKTIEYIRITGSVGLHGEGLTANHATSIKNAIIMANTAKTKYGTDPTICFTLRPYENLTDASVNEEPYLAHLSFILSFIQGHVKDTGLKVAFLLDAEWFVVTEGNKDQIEAKYNHYYEKIKSVFPNSLVLWYGYGYEENASTTGWSIFRWTTAKHKTDGICAVLYRPWDINGCRNAIKKAVTVSPNSPIYAWITFGCGQPYQFNKFHQWHDTYDYPIEMTAILGRESTNWWFHQPERFSNWNEVKGFVIYKDPLNNPVRLKHFIAFINGSNNIGPN